MNYVISFSSSERQSYAPTITYNLRFNMISPLGRYEIKLFNVFNITFTIILTFTNQILDRRVFKLTNLSKNESQTDVT